MQLPIAFRNTIANMMAEAEALNGIFAQDAITDAWYREKGLMDLPYPRVVPGADALYAIDEAFDLSGIAPMIAKPYSPGNAFPAQEVARERIAFDKAMIGSCTNGSYDDLLSAALVLREARSLGFKRVARTLAIFPGSGGVSRQIELADPRLGGESIAEIFRSVGGEIRQSWCGPCFGQGPTRSSRGSARSPPSTGTGRTGWASAARATSRARRSWRPRPSPDMAPPDELGLKWEPSPVRRLSSGRPRDVLIGR
jgi:homoaconitase/3-isopropylmalate dehydratase large subunit